jgi:hypothetical protein
MNMPEYVARDTGINIHTIRKLEERLSAPSLPIFFALFETYGLDFLSCVAESEFFDREMRAASQRALEDHVSASLRK